MWSPSKFPKWTSSTLKNLITNKKKVHVIYKRTKSISDYLVFSEYRAKCKRQSKVDYSAHISRTKKALSSFPSNLWEFVDNLKQKPIVLLSVHLKNITSNTSTESTNLFSAHFSSSFNSSVLQLPPITGSSDYLSYELPSNITFSVHTILSALNSLKNTYSNGPNDISPKCLYKCRFSIAFPIYLLFGSLDLGIFPKVWKISSITPILKFGDPSDVQNYRRISIIPHLGKLFELIVYTRIKRSLNHIIISEQHGFRS